MMVIDWHERIRTDPERLHGQPTVPDLRISVQDVFGYLAADVSIDEMLRECPGLTRDDILACYAWAAEHAADRGFEPLGDEHRAF